MANTRELQILINAKDEASKTIRGISGSIKGLAQDATIGAGIITGAFALTAKSVINASSDYQKSMIGLKTVSRAFKVDANSATEAAQSLAKDGLMSVKESADGLKNLLATGFSLPEAIKLMNGFKDSASFNRQGMLGFGEAIVGATQGIKNQNSIMVDNAGITKNLSIILKEAGLSVNDLGRVTSDASVRSALFNGILKETSIFAGDAQRASETYAGKLSELQTAVFNLKVRIGDELLPIITKFIEEGLLPLVEKTGVWFTQLKENTPIIIGLLSGLVALFTLLGIQFAVMIGPALIIAGLFTLIGLAVGVLVEKNGGLKKTIEDLQTSWDTLKPKLDEIWSKLEKIGNIVRDFLKPSLEELRAALTRLWVEIQKTGITSDTFSNALKRLWSYAEPVVAVLGTALVIATKLAIDVFTRIIKSIADGIKWWKDLYTSIQSIITVVTNLLKPLTDLISKLETLKKIGKISVEIFQKITSSSSKKSKQHGGFIDAPYQQEVPTVLHGGERVVPRTGTDVNKGSGGAMTLNINFSGPVSMDSESRVNELASQVVRLLGRQNELASLGLSI